MTRQSMLHYVSKASSHGTDQLGINAFDTDKLEVLRWFELADEQWELMGSAFRMHVGCGHWSSSITDPTRNMRHKCQREHRGHMSGPITTQSAADVRIGISPSPSPHSLHMPDA